jgi:Na+/melibiose symporter-like transporter
MVKMRKTSSFEKMLLIVGLLVLVIGYTLIKKTYVTEGQTLSWGFLQTIFLWLLMVIFIIMLAIGEDIKEGILIEQLEEIKSLKDSMFEAIKNSMPKGKKKG